MANEYTEVGWMGEQSDAKSEASAMDAAVRAVSDRLARALKHVQTLEARLAPVLQPQDETNANNPAEVHPIRSPLVESVRLFEKGAAELDTCLTSILERLEI